MQPMGIQKGYSGYAGATCAMLGVWVKYGEMLPLVASRCALFGRFFTTAWNLPLDSHHTSHSMSLVTTETAMDTCEMAGVLAQYSAMCDNHTSIVVKKVVRVDMSHSF
jgi:hypothetical protein